MQFFASAASLLCLLAAPVVGVPAQPAPAGLTSNTSPLLTDTKFQTTVASTVNKYRAAHNTAPLVWSSTLATYAQTQANKCVMQHSGGPYGENIYWVSSPSLNFTTATQNAVDAWMSEQPLYTPDSPYKALHYTAVLWKASQRIGCAWTTKTCTNANGGFYYFCEFDPAGNVLGQFSANVS